MGKPGDRMGKPGDRRFGPGRKRKPRPRFLDSMSSEQRRRFHENLEMWKSMSPEQKEAMQERHRRLIREMRREFEEQAEKKNITLDSEQRRRAFIAYLLLRRQLENQLREDAAQKREEALPGIFDTAVEKARTGGKINPASGEASSDPGEVGAGT